MGENVLEKEQEASLGAEEDGGGGGGSTQEGGGRRAPYARTRKDGC